MSNHQENKIFGPLPKSDLEIEISKSGAISSKLDEQYELIPYAAMQALARRFAFGAKRHTPRNWEKGDDEFAEIRLRHLYKHVALFAEFHRQQDLDAILCNAAMLAYFKAKGFLTERAIVEYPDNEQS